MFDNLTQAVTFDNLVTPEEKQQLKDALQAIPIVRENLRKAKRLGIDTSETEKSLDESEKKIRALLAELSN